MTLGYLAALVAVLLVSSILATGMSLAGLFKLGGQLRRRPISGDFTVTSVTASDLPPTSASHLDRSTPKLLGLGFQWIGDFRITCSGKTSWARAFLSLDERTFASIVDGEEMPPYVFVSVFEDGAYLESSAAATPDLGGPPNDLLQFNPQPAASVAELWQAHVEAICERRILSGSDVLEWAPEQYREVAVYAHHLLAWQLQGEPKPATPIGRVATASLVS